MEKSKSKKKLIGIIAGCAMAFILTVVVSVAVTLAYFGDKVTGTQTLKMQGRVDLGDAVTLTASTSDPILPGATVKASATVTVAETTGTPTDFVVAIKFTAESTSTETTALQDTAISNFKVAGEGTYYLVKGTDAYADVYYVVASEGATSLAVITGTKTAQALTFDVSTKLNTALTNTSALSEITFTAEVTAIQAFGIDADNPTAPTIAGAQSVIADQAGWTAA